MPKIKLVAAEEDYFHVRYRPPSQFDQIRTPGWAAKVAHSVSRNAKVRMGKTPAGNWLVQSVLIRRGHGKTKNDAMSLASRIMDKVEE